MSAIGHAPMIADPGVIAIAGDWHGNSPWAQQVLDVCAEQGVRTVVHLGDFGLWPAPSGKRYLNRLDEHLVRNDQTIYWVDGNHDDHGRLDSLRPQANGMRRIRDRIWHLPRGFRWTWHDRTWLALGGAHSVDRLARIPGRSWWPGEVVSPRRRCARSTEDRWT